jgi:hypothetical protein
MITGLTMVKMGHLCLTIIFKVDDEGIYQHIQLFVVTE